MRWVVLTGGPNLNYDALVRELSPDDRIICADSGAYHAKQMCILPSKLLGDLDSIDPDTLSWIRELKIPLEVFPVEKDMTDTELCLRSIPSEHPVLLICSLTGRPDHVLSNLLLSGRLVEEGRDLTITDGSTWIYACKGPASFRLNNRKWRTSHERDKLAVSLLPLFQEVTGVTTAGLRYALKGRTLIPGSSFSISNAVQKNAKDIGVDFTGGTMLIMVTPAV